MATCLNNLAAERVNKAKELLLECRLCPRECGVNRVVGEKGYCRLDYHVKYFREVVHSSEEKDLIPSHQIYFAGCNLRCEYCSVQEWNEQPDVAEEFDPDSLADIITQRHREGAATLNLMGGEPSVSIHGVLELLARINSDIKVVWNSNMYYRPIIHQLLDGLIDVYLADFKCGNPQCADKILGAYDYVEIVKNNLKSIEDRGQLIVRYLMMPGHMKCCLEPILAWLSENLPSARLSLWKNYVPPIQAKWMSNKYVTDEEWNTARAMARQYGMRLSS